MKNVFAVSPTITPMQHMVAFTGDPLTVANSRGTSRHVVAKRLVDIYVSAGALLLLLPVLAVICIAIRAESKGSPIFSQLRWGKAGSKIRIYKFRSMKTELCDETGVAQTVSNDPRVTKVGAFLRRTNLDEVPQLFNVLRGEMSLVGPRCHAIGMKAGGVLYEELVPAYHERHLVKPGLTGLAQVRGLRGPTTDPKKARARIALDLLYMRKFSFWLDLRIMGMTVASELRGGTGY